MVEQQDLIILINKLWIERNVSNLRGHINAHKFLVQRGWKQNKRGRYTSPYNKSSYFKAAALKVERMIIRHQIEKIFINNGYDIFNRNTRLDKELLEKLAKY